MVQTQQRLLMFLAALVALTINTVAWGQNEDMASLNSVPREDVKDVERLSTLARLIKPYCLSMLPEELPFPPVPVVVDLPESLLPLWLEAAKRPETDLKLQAAEAIARAHRHGMPSSEETIAQLVELLDEEGSDPLVQLAAARALIELDARQTAPLLKRKAATGEDLARVIEPALAKWDEPSMRDVWLPRLEAADSSPGLTILAIQSAAVANLKEASPHLRTFVFDPRTAPHVRIEAAKSLGQLADEQAIDDARQLLARKPQGTKVLNLLLAAYLLTKQSGNEAESILLQLATESPPASAAIALRRLIDLDPARAEPVVTSAISSPDPQLRKLAGEVLFRLQSADSIERLAELLNDPHPDVRSSAQEWLIESANTAELTEAVQNAVFKMLNSDEPRGMAQSAIVVGTLDYEPAGERLVELLGHDEGDVSISAGWALRRLAAPETAEQVLAHLRAEVEDSLIERPKPSRGGPPLDWIWDMYEQHKHLIELLGLLEYRPADSLLRSFISFPTNPPLGHPFVWIHCTHRRELRSRAIWALGRIHSEEPIAELVQSFSERLQDLDEVSHVAAMSALSLGRMRAIDAEPALRQFYEPGVKYSETAPPLSVRVLACRLALEWLTGETLPMPEVEPYVISQAGWFLEPLDVEDAASPE